MFIDTSAICAILMGEPEGADFIKRIDAVDVRLTSGLALYEATVALARQVPDAPQALTDVNDFVASANLEIVPIGKAEYAEAFRAFARFGKGRHPARLNMGDCFAYACARLHEAPLLFKGDDFAHTDVAAA